MGHDSFEGAYQRWYPAVVRSAWSITRDLAVAEELAQEAFVKAYARWRRLAGSGHAEPWIHRVVMNLALSWVRRHRRGRQLEAFVDAHRPPEPSAGLAADARVIALLGRLPRRQREAVFLRVVADLPESEVADLMGCSAGTVKVHKHRGLAALRDLVDDRVPTHETNRGAGHVAAN